MLCSLCVHSCVCLFSPCDVDAYFTEKVGTDRVVSLIKDVLTLRESFTKPPQISSQFCTKVPEGLFVCCRRIVTDWLVV